eukprot:8061417-Lingulodinium_polyedra.AAC.1
MAVVCHQDFSLTRKSLNAPLTQPVATQSCRGFREGQATVKKEHQDLNLTTPRKLKLMYEHQGTKRQRLSGFTWHGWRYLGPGGARKSGTLRHIDHD